MVAKTRAPYPRTPLALGFAKSARKRASLAGFPRHPQLLTLSLDFRLVPGPPGSELKGKMLDEAEDHGLVKEFSGSGRMTNVIPSGIPGRNSFPGWEEWGWGHGEKLRELLQTPEKPTPPCGVLCSLLPTLFLFPDSDLSLASVTLVARPG